MSCADFSSLLLFAMLYMLLLTTETYKWRTGGTSENNKYSDDGENIPQNVKYYVLIK